MESGKEQLGHSAKHQIFCSCHAGLEQYEGDVSGRTIFVSRWIVGWI